jgi:hypothetical protein
LNYLIILLLHFIASVLLPNIFNGINIFNPSEADLSKRKDSRLKQELKLTGFCRLRLAFYLENWAFIFRKTYINR